VDEVVPLDRVVEAAKRRCEEVIALPSNAYGESRARMRRDLVEMIGRHREGDTRRLAETWFEPELQKAMHELVARLKGR
jgi:hypothetical protein